MPTSLAEAMIKTTLLPPGERNIKGVRLQYFIILVATKVKSHAKAGSTQLVHNMSHKTTADC